MTLPMKLTGWLSSFLFNPPPTDDDDDEEVEENADVEKDIDDDDEEVDGWGSAVVLGIGIALLW